MMTSQLRNVLTQMLNAQPDSLLPKFSASLARDLAAFLLSLDEGGEHV